MTAATRRCPRPVSSRTGSECHHGRWCAWSLRNAQRTRTGPAASGPIVELHRQGLKGCETARELSVSAGLVSTRLKEARSAGIELTGYATAGEGELSPAE